MHGFTSIILIDVIVETSNEDHRQKDPEPEPQGDRVIEIEEDDASPPKTSIFGHFTKLMRSLFASSPSEAAVASKDEMKTASSSDAAPIFNKLRDKCTKQAASQIATEFTSYKAVQTECKRLRLGAKGTHRDLKDKLIIHRAESYYKSDIAELEARLKNYRPEDDPEDAVEFNDLYQVIEGQKSFLEPSK